MMKISDAGVVVELEQLAAVTGGGWFEDAFPFLGLPTKAVVQGRGNVVLSGNFGQQNIVVSGNGASNSNTVIGVGAIGSDFSSHSTQVLQSA